MDAYRPIPQGRIYPDTYACMAKPERRNRNGHAYRMDGTRQAFYPSAAEFQYRVLGMTYSHIINNRIYNVGSIENPI
jgi:hypothetical protein